MLKKHVRASSSGRKVDFDSINAGSIPAARSNLYSGALTYERDALIERSKSSKDNITARVNKNKQIFPFITYVVSRMILSNAVK